MELTLNLGCGKQPYKSDERREIVNLDRLTREQLKVPNDVLFQQHDLRNPLPFCDSHFDHVAADMLFEHLGDEFIPLMKEIWRVLKPTGRLTFVVPLFPSSAALNHPDHKRLFIRDTFAFFQVPADGRDVHGYMDGCFFHVCLNAQNGDTIEGTLYPNKRPGGRFPHQEILE